MKSRPLITRFRFALAGLRYALRHERSFRTHLSAVLFVAVAVFWFRPPLIWQALLWVMVALVLAAELFNTALEATLDALHPQQAEFVRNAKDCAAAAVLILSIAALLVFALMALAIKLQ